MARVYIHCLPDILHKNTLLGHEVLVTFPFQHGVGNLQKCKLDFSALWTKKMRSTFPEGTNKNVTYIFLKTVAYIFERATQNVAYIFAGPPSLRSRDQKAYRKSMS